MSMLSGKRQDCIPDAVKLTSFNITTIIIYTQDYK